MNTLCDPWGVWDKQESRWVHTRLGTKDAAESAAAGANMTRSVWVTLDRYEARRFTGDLSTSQS